MRAVETDIVVLDFESTGAVGGYPDEPWQIGIVRLVRGRIADAQPFESLLRVGDRPFSRHAPGRHAARRRDLATAPRLADLWPQLRSWLGGPLAGHNIATEKRFLKQAFPLHAAGPWIDTLKVLRVAYPDLSSHKLDAVLAALKLTARVDALLPGRAPHDALYDAFGSAALLEHLFAQPDWAAATVPALVAARPVRFHRRVAIRRNRG